MSELSTPCNKVHLVKSLSLDPAEDTDIAGLKTKMTVQAETAGAAANMDQTAAIFESGGLSKAHILKPS